MAIINHTLSLANLPAPPKGKSGWPWTEQSELLNARMPDNSEWPKISIVTPSYNQGIFIEETIRSVLLQGYPNLEYIIIDGNSTDNTLTIIQKYEAWLTYWVSESDRGQSHAINKGLKIATGEIFNWLNSDDYYSQNSLFYVAEAFLSPGIDIVGGKERRFGKNLSSNIHNGTVIFENLAHTVYQGFNVQPCTFFRLGFLKNSGFLNEKFHYFMDSEIFIRYLLINGQLKIRKIDRTVSNFRLHSHSKTVQDISSSNINFSKERWSLRYSVARQLGMDCKTLEITQQLFKIIEHDDWDIRQEIDLDFYFYHYLVDIMEILLSNNLGREARYCLLQLSKLKMFRWSPGYFLILVETFYPSFKVKKTLKSLFKRKLNIHEVYS